CGPQLPLRELRGRAPEPAVLEGRHAGARLRQHQYLGGRALGRHRAQRPARVRSTLRVASSARGSLVSIPAPGGGPFTTLPVDQIQVTRTGTQRAELDQYVLNNAEVAAKFNTW